MKKFTIGVEKLIDPISVGTLHFIQGFNDKVPISIQKKLVDKSAQKNPFMGFVVDPYCYFLAYEITDKEYFQRLLPKKFKLVKTKIFANEDDAKYYYLMGCFNARTSAFFGSRVEAYVIAENQETGLLSWVIIDYDTNTISYDPKNGLIKPTAPESVVTTDYQGRVIVEVQNKVMKRKINFTASLKEGILTKLDSKLWIEGNLSVGYGKNHSDNGDIFSLRFDPKEMKEALDLPLDSIIMNQNDWYRKYIADKPSRLICFPYAQHFISDSPGHSSNIKNETELLDSIQNVNFSSVEVYSSESFKRAIIFVPMILMLIILILLLI